MGTPETSKQKGMFGKSQAARNSAIRELVSRHEEEFQHLLFQEREAAGLPADPQMARKKAAAQRHIEKLKALGIDVSGINL